MKIFGFAVSLFISSISFATLWSVGPSHTYTQPSQVVNLVMDGDTIQIDGGVYLNDASKWTKRNLKIIGLGSGMNRTILRFNTTIPNGKGIFVFETPGNCDNVYIENIVFDGAQVTDNDGGNGAGIRFQAKDLTIKNCKFINCQNGILEGHGNVSTSNVILLDSEFDNNGYQIPNDPVHSGYEHHIYISSSSDTLHVQNCYFHDPRGQANSLKTRAQRNFILYNFIDEGDNGYGSYELNIAQGGLCVIMGNIIVQGISGANHAMIGYDAVTNPIQDFYFVNNTVINFFNGNVRYFAISPSSGINTFKIYNNIFASVSGANISFFGTNTPSSLDSLANLITNDIASQNFVDIANGNYNLTLSSMAINQGVAAGNTNTSFPLVPLFQYQNFDLPLIQRTVMSSQIDLGAYEYFASAEQTENALHSEISIYPNPSNGKIYLQQNENKERVKVSIMNQHGEILYQGENVNGDPIDLSLCPSGIYLLKLIWNDQIRHHKLVLH